MTCWNRHPHFTIWQCNISFNFKETDRLHIFKGLVRYNTRSVQKVHGTSMKEHRYRSCWIQKNTFNIRTYSKNTVFRSLCEACRLLGTPLLDFWHSHAFNGYCIRSYTFWTPLLQFWKCLDLCPIFTFQTFTVIYATVAFRCNPVASQLVSHSFFANSSSLAFLDSSDGLASSQFVK